ncbi:DUF2931 family protein [Pseudomonas sp. KSR10]|uniref:DUF2931 family protein n=1 Tax=Pseudomonas sp. KSR10 TaxID=2916654 RepID=UPI001EF94C4C|nr:DUF2931 family protein [Pseudomonas sp. KSR10]MCG6539312.1 DUF2931 family protein [Pseudomonas sp. KSR10]
MNKSFFFLIPILLLIGCKALGPVNESNGSKSPWWSLEFVAPPYMVGWVEASIVEDVEGRLFDHGGGGVVGSGDPGYATEVARGWPHGLAGGQRAVVGAGLPKRIFVRWQSVVEPQTYRGWIEIPDDARKIMQDSTNHRCSAERPARYMASLYLGLAPGGVVQAWVRDQCHNAVKIARAQAEIEPLGPSQGKTDGRYAYKINEKTKRYIDKYGIPYGSW